MAKPPRARHLVFDRMRFTRNGIRFFYEIDGATWTYFSSYRDVRPTLPQESLYQVAAQIGLSYLVDLAILVLPESIIVRPIRLTPSAIRFWNEAYQQLAMERLFEERLDTSLLAARWLSPSDVAMRPIKTPPPAGTLLAMSGGKESLTALKLLRRTDNLGLFFLQYEGPAWHHMRRSYDQLQKDHPVMRIGQYRPRSLEVINRYRASDYFTFVIGQLIFNALLYSDRYRYLVIGNEYSANFGNAKYQGRAVNHQYDKSLRFAVHANRYIQRHVSKGFAYFSPFFGLYEYRIAQLFFADSKYQDLWTSCNYSNADANFCCRCVKCAFTYAICLPWTSKKRLKQVFGQDLLCDLNLYKSLMDPDAMKPLDCIGEKEEVWLALYRVWLTKQDRTSPVIRHFVTNILPDIQPRLPAIEKELESEHTALAHVPEQFRSVIRRALAKGRC